MSRPSGSNVGIMAEETTKPQPYSFDRVVRLTISAITIAVLIWLLRYLSDVLVPFAVALLLAYLLNPIVNALEGRLRNRAVAVLTTVFGCLVVLVAAVLLLVPIISSQLADFETMVARLRADTPAVAPPVSQVPPGDAEEAATLAERFDRFTESQPNENLRWVLERVRDFVTSEDFNIGALLLSAGRRLAPGIWGVVTGALSFVLGLTGLMVTLLYLVFLLNDFRIVETTWKENLPPRYREPLINFIDEFHAAMRRYFRGQFCVAFCVGVLFAIGFSIIGLRMGILLGLFVGVLNMVPYAQTIGLIPAGLLGILRAVEHDSSVWVSLLLVLAVFAVVQTIQDAILTPRIVGRATGLRPALILLGVFVWGKLLGFLGVVLAIPLSCMGLAYYRRFVLKVESS